MRISQEDYDELIMILTKYVHKAILQSAKRDSRILQASEIRDIRFLAEAIRSMETDRLFQRPK